LLSIKSILITNLYLLPKLLVFRLLIIELIKNKNKNKEIIYELKANINKLKAN
jgi:hypothetical protein